MGLLRRVLNAILSPLVTLFFVLFFCFILPRSFLDSDFNLFALDEISDFKLFTVEIGLFSIAGFFFIIVGIITIIGAIWGFLLQGTGSPVPFDLPDKLVAGGSYRFVRNPMYFGCCIILFGQALFYKTFGYLIFLMGYFLAIHMVVVGFEEPMLKEQYGESYDRYCNSVPRWIPRLRLFRIDRSKSSNQANSVDS